MMHGQHARTVTKRNTAGDKRLGGLMSYFIHTQHYRQYCFVGNKNEDCKLGLFQDASFAGDL